MCYNGVIWGILKRKFQGTDLLLEPVSSDHFWHLCAGCNFQCCRSLLGCACQHLVVLEFNEVCEVSLVIFMIKSCIKFSKVFRLSFTCVI